MGMRCHCRCVVAGFAVGRRGWQCRGSAAGLRTRTSGDGTLAWRLLIALAVDCDEGTASAARDVDELGCVAVAESSGERLAALGRQMTDGLTGAELLEVRRAAIEASVWRLRGCTRRCGFRSNHSLAKRMRGRRYDVKLKFSIALLKLRSRQS